LSSRRALLLPSIRPCVCLSLDRDVPAAERRSGRGELGRARRRIIQHLTRRPVPDLDPHEIVRAHSRVANPRKPKDPPTELNAAVGRYNPRTDTFEVWCDGISNQWGVDWDAAGNAFVSACVVDHIWHVVPGGVYQRQGGVPTIPFTYELLPPINKDKHRHYMAAYGGIGALIGRAVHMSMLFPIGMLVGLAISLGYIIYRYGRQDAVARKETTGDR